MKTVFTVEEAARKFITIFSDVCDTGTLAEMLWAYDQGRKSLGYYHDIMEELLKDLANG